MPKPSKDHIEIFHDYGLYIPTRTILLESAMGEEGEEMGVNYAMATYFLKNLHILETINKDPITVIINTEGGDIYQGMAIYDEIVRSECQITGIVKGNAASMGSIILQSCDVRILREHAHVMFHAGTAVSVESNPDEALNSIKFEVDYGKKLDNILFKKIEAKYHSENKAFTLGKFKDLNLKGRYMHAQEAVDMGLADRIE